MTKILEGAIKGQKGPFLKLAINGLINGSNGSLVTSHKPATKEATETGQ